MIDKMASTVGSKVLKQGKIAIIGSGFIGRSWSMLFAGAGYHVTLYDIASGQVSAALEDVQQQLKTLETKNLLRGSLSAEEQFKFIEGSVDITQAVLGAVYVLECIPERLEMKIDIFKRLDVIVSDDTILASSTSCIKASQFSEHIKHRSNVIVTHPVNPPYYVPLVELVPSPWTKPDVVQLTRDLMVELGQAPVILHRELDGFALNRIQYAILNECWNLVESGVMSVPDVDTVMTAGLGRRYAFLGPLETCHLNAYGIEEYCEKYGDGIRHVSSTFQPIPKLSVESARSTGVSAALFAAVPGDKIKERIKWRDERLAALSDLKKRLGDK